MPAEYNPEMQKLQLKILETRKELVRLKKGLSVGLVNDYEFHSSRKAKVKLSELFGDHDDLIIIQNMGHSCKYCTLWADGFSGLIPHLENRASLALVSPDPIEKALDFAASRDWNYKVLSSDGSSFKIDLGFHSDADGTLPGLSTFRKMPDGSIKNVANDFFGPGDDYCSQWHILELLEDGVNAWVPEYRYD